MASCVLPSPPAVVALVLPPPVLGAVHVEGKRTTGSDTQIIIKANGVNFALRRTAEIELDDRVFPDRIREGDLLPQVARQVQGGAVVLDTERAGAIL